MSIWKSVTANEPCAICHKTDWCRRSDDGALECHRVTGGAPGFKLLKHTQSGFGLYRPAATAQALCSSQQPDTRKSQGHIWRTPKAFAQKLQGRLASQWTYHDTDGSTAFVVIRVDGPNGKTFRPLRPVSGGWVVGDPPGKLPLYNLPEIRNATTVYVCEGEKCADAARSIGLVATTSAHGSKSPHKTDWTPLAGRIIAILPDNDVPGRAYANTVAPILTALDPPASVKIVELPGLGVGGDIVDHIAARYSEEQSGDEIRAEIEALADQTQLVKPVTLRGPIVTCMADVTPQPVEWLWPKRIALGKLTLLVGDPGLGKSFVTLDIASRVSRGARWPHSLDAAPNGSVLLLSAEDDPGDTIRPRLDAACADVSRVHVLTTVKRPDGALSPISLDRDMPELERAIAKLADCRLVAIDPVTAYLGLTDSHKNAEVRGLLAPLAELALRHRVAVLAVTHLNKSRDSSVIYRAMGSLAFVAAARAAMLVVRDKADPSRRLLLPAKNNLAPLGNGLAFRFIEDALAWDTEPVSVTADDALSAEPTADRSERDDAADWLQQLLADGPVESKAVRKLAGENGHTWTTVRRAKLELGIRARKQGFRDGAGWYWYLPAGRRRSADPEDARGKTVSAFDDGERIRVFDPENGVSEPSIAEGAHRVSVSAFDEPEQVRTANGDNPNSIPSGWTRTSWARRLRQRACACESTNPELAAELRQQAARLEKSA